MKEIQITSQNFETEVLRSDVPVLVDFWATWCGPCMMFAPTVEEIAVQSDGSYKVVKVNVDEQGALAMQFGIESIPTLLLFKNGEVVSKLIGLQTKERIMAMLS